MHNGKPQKGTIGHKFNSVRQDLLVALQNDLQRCEQKGLDDDSCRTIIEFLGCATNAASAIPNATLLGRPIYKHFQAYKDNYTKWNNIDGCDTNAVDSRRKQLKRLRGSRQRLAKAYRKNTHALSEGIDLRLIKAIYSAAEQIVEQAPQSFQILTEAVSRFSKLVSD